MINDIIILAAGKGKRMASSIPKVLHPLAGKPLLSHVFDKAEALNPESIHVIVSHESEKIIASYASPILHWVHQSSPLGTGHAVLQALPYLNPEGETLILYGDVPLISTETLQALIECHQKNPTLTLLTAIFEHPFGFGRILRNDDNHQIIAIIEEKDATPEQKAIHEIYSGICLVKTKYLHEWLPKLTNHNAQKEYYLTDIIAMAKQENITINSHITKNPFEIQGVNDKVQLHSLERIYQKKQAECLLEQGVTLADSSRIDIRGTLTVGKDVFIDVNTVFIGDVIIGDRCHIEPNTILKNVTMGHDNHILANCYLDGVTLENHCSIGPFARLRPKTNLSNHCKIGNFVETKNAKFGEYSKASHLSYLGDITIGKHVNIGAGTITCNYDGVNKHHTLIEDGAFIGSDSQLVAPVTVGANATLGAGTTLRKDAPPNALTITESKQKTLTGWRRKE